MTASEDIHELSRLEFEELVQQNFEFLVGAGFPFPLFWEFADTLYVSFENRILRTVTWCGRREDSVWTNVERLDIRRGIGLDTANSVLESPFEYPPDTGSPWSAEWVCARVGLEAAILRAHLPTLVGSDVSIFHEYGSASSPDFVAVDDVVATFPRTCADRLRFLEDEYGFKRELDSMGAAVLYRGVPISVRVSLLDTAYENEDEPQPTLMAEIAKSPEGRVPPFMFDSEEVEISDRRGPSSDTYLETALREVELELRRRLPRGGDSGA